jgi:hypothetical protein
MRQFILIVIGLSIVSYAPPRNLMSLTSVHPASTTRPRWPRMSTKKTSGAVFEFTVNEPGIYNFMDLNRASQYKGAAGIVKAEP